MQSIVAVGLGGCLGAITRYWVTTRVGEQLANWFSLETYYATAFVNVTGSLLLGLLFVTARHFNLSTELVLLLGTGFLGAYTTFSTFANESLTLFQAGNLMAGVSYIVGTNLLCLVGAAIGVWLGNQLLGVA